MDSMAHQKSTKIESEYVPARAYTGDQFCEDCRMYLSREAGRAGTCMSVEGSIELKAHCKLWEPKERDT